MGEFRFENVRLLLADPNPQVRYGLKSALFHEGFRDVLDCASYPPVLEAVKRNIIDVMICDVDMPGGNICNLVHQVRHHKVGANPFLVVLAVVGGPTEQVIRQVVDCGADDIIVKPFSPETLLNRIKLLARGRKPFVVTHDYIGPDRRKQPREGAQPAALLEVPNPLRSKAVANADSASLQRLIDTAAARINQQKMERYAAQIGYLAERITPHFVDGRLAAGEPGLLAEILGHLRRLSYVAEDLGYRMRGTPYAHVAELALSLIGVADRIRISLEEPGNEHAQGNPADGFVDHRDVELLPKIALALGRAFSAEVAVVQAAQQISDQVRGFGERRPAGAAN